jgi:hypothetical protein
LEIEMTAEVIKSTVITNLDATPPVRGTAGAGGPAMFMNRQFGSVQPQTGATSGSVYRLARVPSNAYALRIQGLTDGTITTLTGDVTIYYSDQALDEVGSGQGNSGLVNSLSGASSLFNQAHAFGSDTRGAFVELTDVTQNYGPAKWGQPLWQAAGLSSDPGGFFDVVVLTTATNSLTNGANLAAVVDYAMPYA